MNWNEFKGSASEIAGIAEEQFAGAGIAMLATIRRDGSPRISPCEVYIVDGELLLGMMWHSKKALDLLRDSRIAVHTPTANRAWPGGDAKIYGKARVVSDPVLRRRHADAQQAAIGWRPSEPYHLFAVDIESAGYISFGESRRLLRWTAVAGSEELRHPDD